MLAWPPALGALPDAAVTALFVFGCATYACGLVISIIQLCVGTWRSTALNLTSLAISIVFGVVVVGFMYFMKGMC